MLQASGKVQVPIAERERNAVRALSPAMSPTRSEVVPRIFCKLHPWDTDTPARWLFISPVTCVGQDYSIERLLVMLLCSPSRKAPRKCLLPQAQGCCCASREGLLPECGQEGKGCDCTASWPRSIWVKCHQATPWRGRHGQGQKRGESLGRLSPLPGQGSDLQVPGELLVPPKDQSGPQGV